FPKHLTDLRDKFVDNAKRGGSITASHIKDILRKMTVRDDESKLHFKKLMIYYLIEEVLLCGGNSKNQRKMCGVWSKILKNKGALVEHCFTGSTPVLEAVMFECIPKIRPRTSSTVSP
nr:protein root hair defective 3 [Tanacetum cinerariifolium]